MEERKRSFRGKGRQSWPDRGIRDYHRDARRYNPVYYENASRFYSVSLGCSEQLGRLFHGRSYCGHCCIVAHVEGQAYA